MVPGDLREGVAPGRAPLGARILDALAIAALIIAAAVVFTGGFVIHLGPLEFSSHSVLRPLLLAGVLIAVRHVAWRGTESLRARLATWGAGLQPDSRASLVAVAVASRAAVLLAGYFAVLTIGFAQPPGFRVSRDPLVDLPARYDAGWYGGIALEGYEFVGRFDRQQNIAFFPAYPMLMRAGGAVFGAFDTRASEERRMARAVWAGTLISILAFAWAAVYLRRLVADTVGEQYALSAVALLAAYPFAVFFSAPYTESLFLLGSVAALYHFRRRAWVAAGAWGLLVGLTRPNGCLLSIVLVCVIAEHLWRRTRTGDYFLGAAVAAAAAPGIGMLAYAAYVRQLSGTWLGWTLVQQGWGRSFEGLPDVEPLWETIADGELLRAFGELPFDMLNGLGLLFSLAMLWPVFRRLGLAAGVFILVNVVPGMLTGGVLSMGRFSATLFPMFIALAAMLPRPLLAPAVVAWAIGQGLVAALFFTWRPLF